MNDAERLIVTCALERLEQLEHHMADVAYDLIRRHGDDSPEDIAHAERAGELSREITNLKSLLK